MDTESTQSFAYEADWARCSQPEPKIPIRGKPEGLVQATRVNHRISPENRGGDGNEVLHQKPLDKLVRGNGARLRKWASPGAELLSVRAHVHGIVNDERALVTLHLAAQSF